jgi:aspartyl-tRNA(Asn)/glutamyl-tRNA(Gln) amidotransferase subunit B
MESLGLSAYDASVLSADQASALYFEAASAGHDAKLVANWVTAELFGRLNKLGCTIEDCPVSAENFSGLITLIENDTISGKIAKTVLDKMVETGRDAKSIVESEGLTQVTDTGAIEAVIDQVMAANPDKVAEFKSGKDKLFGFFVGQVMKLTEGKANPQAVNDILRSKLS